MLHVLPYDNKVALNVATIVVNYNNYVDTCRCIRALQKSSICPKYIIIVDNSSDDESWEYFLNIFSALLRTDLIENAKYDQISNTNHIIISKSSEYESVSVYIKFIRSVRNDGFGAGNNTGYSFLYNINFSGYIWILNNDTEVFVDCLEQLKILGDRDALPALVGTTLTDFGVSGRVQACGGSLSRVGLLTSHLHAGLSLEALRSIGEIVYADYPVGASFLIHTELIRGDKLFDERYFLYYEELALIQRLGITHVAISTRSVVAHKGGASTGAFGPLQTWNALADFHSIRSRILFGRQTGPLGAFSAVAAGFAIVMKRLWQIGPSAAHNALRGILSAFKI